MTFPLKNPPLREAIFELFADPEATTQWSSSPENVLKQLPEYAHHEERMQDFGIQFQVGPDGPVARQYTPQSRIRRWNQARQTAVQLGSHMCAYNILGGDYQQFENHVVAITRIAQPAPAADWRVRTSRFSPLANRSVSSHSSRRVPSPITISHTRPRLLVWCRTRTSSQRFSCR